MRAAAESPPIQERRRDVRVSPRDGVSEPDVDRMVADHCKCALSCARRGCPPQSFTTTRPRTTACVAVPCSRATARVLHPRTLVFCATYPWNKCPKARTVARIPTDPPSSQLSPPACGSPSSGTTKQMGVMWTALAGLGISNRL
jgi:hypothetical protein